VKKAMKNFKKVTYPSEAKKILPSKRKLKRSISKNVLHQNRSVLRTGKMPLKLKKRKF
jgi:hypothetical protein